MLNFKKTSFVTLLGVAALAFTAKAQTPSPLVQVARVVMKTDRVAECREVTKRFSEAHKKGGGAFRHVWRNAVGNPYEYAIVTPMANYAQRDSPGPGRRGMSEAERAELAARRRLCTDSVEITIRRPIPELSIPWSSGQPPKMLTTRTTRVRPGMANQYIEHRKELVAALKKAGVPAYGVHQVRWGGTREFVSWTSLDKMADLDGEGWLAKSMSEDVRIKWIEKAQSMVESTEVHIWAYQPELSYQSEQ